MLFMSSLNDLVSGPAPSSMVAVGRQARCRHLLVSPLWAGHCGEVGMVVTLTEMKAPEEAAVLSGVFSSLAPFSGCSQGPA